MMKLYVVWRHRGFNERRDIFGIFTSLERAEANRGYGENISIYKPNIRVSPIKPIPKRTKGHSEYCTCFGCCYWIKKYKDHKSTPEIIKHMGKINVN